MVRAIPVCAIYPSICLWFNIIFLISSNSFIPMVLNRFVRWVGIRFTVSQLVVRTGDVFIHFAGICNRRAAAVILATHSQKDHRWRDFLPVFYLIDRKSWTLVPAKAPYHAALDWAFAVFRIFVTADWGAKTSKPFVLYFHEYITARVNGLSQLKHSGRAAAAIMKLLFSYWSLWVFSGQLHMVYHPW